MSAIDTAPGLAADVARIKRIEQLESLLVEANEYARKLGLKVTDLGNDIQKFKAERDEWKKLAEMLIELQSDEFPAGGEAMIDLRRDAWELYEKLKEATS